MVVVGEVGPDGVADGEPAFDPGGRRLADLGYAAVGVAGVDPEGCERGELGYRGFDRGGTGDARLRVKRKMLKGESEAAPLFCQLPDVWHPLFFGEGAGG